MSARSRQPTASSRSSPNRPSANETTGTSTSSKGNKTSNGGRMRNSSSTGYSTSPSVSPPRPSKTLGPRRSTTPGEASPPIKTTVPALSDSPSRTPGPRRSNTPGEASPPIKTTVPALSGSPSRTPGSRRSTTPGEASPPIKTSVQPALSGSPSRTPGPRRSKAPGESSPTIKTLLPAVSGSPPPTPSKEPGSRLSSTAVEDSTTIETLMHPTLSSSPSKTPGSRRSSYPGESSPPIKTLMHPAVSVSRAPTPTKTRSSRRSSTSSDASQPIKTLMPAAMSGTRKKAPSASPPRKSGSRVPSARVIAPRQASTKTLLTRVPSTKELVAPEKLVDMIPSTKTIENSSPSTKIIVTPIPSTKTIENPSPSTKIIVTPIPSTKIIVTPIPSTKILVTTCSSTKLVAPITSTTIAALAELAADVQPAPPPSDTGTTTTTTVSQSPIKDEPRDLTLDEDYAAVYTPQPYTFRLYDKEIGPDAAVDQLPPYWMLMDHMLAVLWCLNSPRHKNIPLSISQLQWALYILTSIKTKRGDHARDVSALIDMIQDRLLDSYASIAKTNHAEDSGHKIKSINTSKKHATGTEEAKKKNTNDVRSTKQDGRRSPQTSDLSSFEDLEDMMSNKKPRNLTVCPYRQTPATRSRPASIGYDEIMLRSPPQVQGSRPRPVAIRSRVVCRRKIVLENIDATDAGYRSTAGSTAWVNGVPSRPQTPVRFAEPLETSSVTVEEMMSFMHQWRAGQVQRIKSEMTHLRSIEEFMARVNPSSFEPYVQGKLAKRLKDIERKMSMSNYVRSIDAYSY